MIVDLDESYCLAPDVLESIDGAGPMLKNPAQGSRVLTGEMTRWILEHYASARPLRDLQRELSDDDEAPASGLLALVEQLILVPTAVAHILGDGLLRPPRARPIGIYKNIMEARQLAEREGNFAVVGVGCRAGGGVESSAHHGPTAIRANFRAPGAFAPVGAALEEDPKGERRSSDAEPMSLLDFDLERSYPKIPSVVDFGDLLVLEASSLQDAHIRLEAVMDRVLAVGFRPVTLGGDHSITWPILRSLLRVHDCIGIIHFDAHHDLFSERRGRLNHANPFRFALQRPEVAVLHQVGLRTYDWIRPSRILSERRVTYVSALQATRRTPAQVFEGLPRDIPYYLTFDVDCLEPALCGRTNVPEAGGLSYYTALELVDFVSREFSLIGADFVEVGGPPSTNNPGARSVAALLMQVLLSPASFEPIRGYVDAEHLPKIVPPDRNG